MENAYLVTTRVVLSVECKIIPPKLKKVGLGFAMNSKGNTALHHKSLKSNFGHELVETEH